MPANKANARGLCEVHCSQCNLLTRARLSETHLRERTLRLDPEALK